MNRKGEFAFTWRRRGAFVLILYGGEEVLHTQVVELLEREKRGETVRIRLMK